MDKQLYTFKDIPVSNVEEDLLGGKKYSEGLTEYIRFCDTPMTIALQGDWGSGKTSMMNMIKGCLNQESDESIYTVWFNTWQFSQFHSKDNLPIIFLSYLVSKIKEIQNSENDVESGKAEKLLAKIDLLKISAAAVGAALETVAPPLVAAVSKAAYDACKGGDDSKSEKTRELSAADVISTLKDELQEWINEKLFRKADKSYGRIVIFVDDLDRLEPLRAVELLEILKLFMDLEHCVYVLAIDYDVVVRGVKEKYGQGFSEEKGRAFFEKIIQLPFKMPVSSYDIDRYTDSLLKAVGVETTNTEMILRFIKNTIGTNPRTMKRLFNAFSLLRIIAAEKNKDVNRLATEKKALILLGLLCLQMSTEKLYNLILVLRHDLEGDTLQSLSSGSYEELSCSDAYEEPFDDCEIDSVFWNENKGLLGNLHTLIASKDGSKLSTEELAAFRAVLDVSTITSSGNIVKEPRPTSGTGRGARRQDTVYQSAAKEFDISIKMKDIKDMNDGIGLDKCKFVDFCMEGDEKPTAVKNGNELIQGILTRIYKMKPDEFEKLRKEPKERGLASFFYGTGNPPTIKSEGYLQTGKDEDIVIELKNGAGRKIELINQIMRALDMDPASVKYRAQLKEYVS